MKKRLIASLLSVSMALTVFAPMAFAASEITTPPQQSQQKGHIIEIGKDEFSKNVRQAAPIMDEYIIIVDDIFFLDPAAKIYTQYVNFISNSPSIHYVNSVKSNSHTTYGAITWTMKTIKSAFRIGGWALSPIVKLFDKKMGEAVRKNSAKIADALDTIDKWTEETITRALILAKVPEDVAKAIAKVIMTLL